VKPDILTQVKVHPQLSHNGFIYDGLLHLVGANSLWPFDWVLLTSTLVASTLFIFFVKLMRLKTKNFSKKKKIVKKKCEGNIKK
jgi:hypothetical protein